MAAATMQRIPPVVVQHISQEDLEEVGVLPWFSYQVTHPTDLPPLESRPMRTPRLLIRPFKPSDAQALHRLRRDPVLQRRSNHRGLPDDDLEHTERNVAALQSPHDQDHWYFGAFLPDTGELVGEGGLPDIHGRITRSGWPELDFLLAPEHQRQGYGTEFFTAVMDAWWDLPRDRRRRQLHPFVVPNQSPGAKLPDCVVIQYEAANKAADSFFGKMMMLLLKRTGGEEKLGMLRATFEDYDMREGKDHILTAFAGMTMTNPVPFVDEEDDDDYSD